MKSSASLNTASSCDLCVCSTESSEFYRKRTRLSEFIDTNLILQEHIIQFENVPLRERKFDYVPSSIYLLIVLLLAIKKTIYVGNLTPLNGVLSLQVTHFYANHIPEEKEIMAKVLRRAKQRTNSKIQMFKSVEDFTKEQFSGEFDDFMNDDGFIIIPQPGNTQIRPYEKIQIDIYVYAHTWGVYCDEVIVEVNECLPFAFNVIAKIVGMPIEYPFALNSISNEPTCR